MTEQLETIEAIPTTLNGIAFRSRLEARWSLFLTALDIVWVYEPWTYQLARQGWYKPDFYLPSYGCFLEIKPAEHQVNYIRYTTFVNLVHQPHIVICGPPRAGDYEAKLFRSGVGVEQHLRWAIGRRDHRELWLCSIESGVAVCLSERSVRANWPVADCHILREASRQAMGWRFEGEG